MRKEKVLGTTVQWKYEKVLMFLFSLLILHPYHPLPMSAESMDLLWQLSVSCFQNVLAHLVREASLQYGCRRPLPPRSHTLVPSCPRRLRLASDRQVAKALHFLSCTAHGVGCQPPDHKGAQAAVQRPP